MDDETPEQPKLENTLESHHTPPATGLFFKAVKQTWTESERGWGTRPDGYSLHLSVEDMEQYNKEYNDSLPDGVPDEYSRPDRNPQKIQIGFSTHKEIKESKNGIRKW